MLLGLDISERSVAVILADDSGKTEIALRSDLPRVGGASAQWLAAMDVVRQALLQGHAVASQLQSCCLSFHAPLSTEGVVKKDEHAADWENYDLPRALREHLELTRVRVVTRVVAEALGEERLGALRAQETASDWLYVHLGEAVRAAARCGGALLCGAEAEAMALGALCIERGGALASSGRRGTLDAYCGGEAFVARARSYGLSPASAHEVWEMSTAGNAMAQSLCNDYIERLAQGVGAALALLNPAHLIIGGEFGHALGEQFALALRGRLGDYCDSAHWQNLEIGLGQLGRDAAILGAVSLAAESASPRSQNNK
jgi:predicted NBD/HSP70 family sugar kinase